MADNLTANAGSGGGVFATALATWSGDSANFPGSFQVIISGSEGSWSVALVVGGAGAVTSGTQRMTLASDDPAVTSLQLIDDTVYTDGSGTPSKGIAVMGTDGTNPQLISTTSAGVVKVDLSGTAANGTAVKVDGSAVTQPVSGTFWQATQPVSAASLPLPSGASTSAKQPALGTAGTASSDVITVQGIASMTALKVDGSAVTQPVSDGGSTISIDDGSGSITVDGTVAVSGTVTVDSELTTADLDTGAGTDTRAVVGLVLAASGGGLLVGSANPLPISDNGGNLSIDDGGNSITVDGSVTVSQATASSLKATVTHIDSGGTDITDTTNHALKVNVVAGGAGDGAILDGVSSSIKATVLDYTNSNPIAVRLSDTNGDYVAAGAGTQYTEDAAAAADPVGGMLMAVRRDTLSTSEVSADGDNIALKATNKGQLHVKLADTVTVDASGTTLTVASHNVTNAGTFATQAAQSGTWNITNVSGTVSLPTGAATAAKQPALGTAGSASTDVITVQGIASMTALKVDGSAVTQPVSGTVAVTNASLTTLAGAVYAEDTASANADPGMMVLARRTATPANTSGTDGDYESIQISAGRVWTSSVIDTALPAGTNAIGKLASNSGVTIGAVEIASAQTLATVTTVSTVTSLTQFNGNAISTGNGASGTGVLRVTVANDSTGKLATVDTITNVVHVDDNSGSLTVDLPAVATGGATAGRILSAASTNATSVKGSAGTLYSLICVNTNAAVRYLKIYNKATAPTVGTDTPVWTLAIPGNAAGAGFSVPIPVCGVAFGTGIAMALTTGAADNDTGAVAANEITVNYSYK